MKTLRRIALCLVIFQLLLLLASCGGNPAVTTGALTTGTPTVGTTAGKTEPSTTVPPVTEPSTTVPPVTEPGTTVPPVTEPGTTVPPVTEPGTTVPPVTEPSTTVPPVTEPGTTVPPVTEPPEDEIDHLVLAVDGEAQYVIVRDADATEEVVALIQEFAAELGDLMGCTFRVIPDTRVPELENEIIISGFENRDYALSAVEPTYYTESISGVVGETLVLIPTADGLSAMLNHILRMAYELEPDVWVLFKEEMEYVEDEWSGRGIPIYGSLPKALVGGGLYYGNRTGYMVAHENTNLEELNAYFTKLEGLGYTRYAENEIGKVKFYTYVLEEDALYIRYQTVNETPEVRITLARGEFMPAAEPEEYTKLVDSNIVCLERLAGTGHGGSSALWGLNLIYQLADGSFVIVDGSLYTPAHEKMLYDYLMENKPAEHEKPIISCWLWTHGHGDHVDICKNMISRYSDKIEVKTFAYNYPDWSVLPAGCNPGDYFGDGLVRDTQKYYPDANHWIMRSGQRMYIADAVIECIWSHEDTYPMEISGVNDTDTVFRVTIDGIDCMMLGDCQTPNSKMVSHYGDALKSHIVQNAHHTLNGPREMYEYIDPIISFWANTDDALNYGTAHAVYLRTTKWTRTDADGNEVSEFRQHITHSYSTVLYFKDLKEAYGDLK